MGKVAAVYNLVGESPETDMESIMANMAKSIPQGVEIVNTNLKPFAYGLKIIEVTAVMNDVEGIIERLEESLRGIPGIQNVENTQVTLI